MKAIKRILLLGLASTALLFAGCEGASVTGSYVGGGYVGGPYVGPYYGGWGPYGGGDFIFGGTHYYHSYGYHHFYGHSFSVHHFGGGGFHGGGHGMEVAVTAKTVERCLPAAAGQGRFGRNRGTRSAGLEPTTQGLEIPCSIQLSYER